MTLWTREELARRSDDQVAGICQRVSNRVAKWRLVFAGWQLGTRTTEDAEGQAVRDHREATIMLRAESSALVQILIAKGITTSREFTEQMIIELEHLDGSYARKFPGMKSTDEGISFDLPLAAETMKGWRP